ncbi:MAG: hypothetical protein BGO95_06990 [Micrococcales bacterium 73-13]|nr:MAG: hypothetical protein BGO95_06990 [Micrococcales bacterium 73-13]
MTRRRAQSDGRRTWWIVGITAFVLVDIGLVWWAVGGVGRGVDTSAEALPLSSFAPAPTPRPASARATPTPTPTPDPIVLAAMARRIVPIDATRAWRTASVGCPGGASIEWSEDAGASWTAWSAGDDVAGVGDIVAFGDGNTVGIIAALAGDCRQEYRMSFTGGEFWAAYPGEQPDTPIIEPTAGTALVVAAGAVASPCGPISEYAVGSGVAVLCTSTALAIAAADLSGWTTARPDGAAVAVTNLGDGYLVASRRAAGCVDGLRFATVDAAGAVSEGPCLAAAGDEATSVELGTAPDGSVWMWLGDRVAVSGDGGASWAGLG